MARETDRPDQDRNKGGRVRPTQPKPGPRERPADIPARPTPQPRPPLPPLPK